MGGVVHFEHTCPLEPAVAVAAVAVAVAVAVVVCATHGCDGHAERILTFGLELKHVLARFKVVHVDGRSRCTSFGVGNGLFWTDLVVFSVIVLGFILVVAFVMGREGHVVAAIVAVKFCRFAGVVRKDVNVRRSSPRHRGAEFVDEDGLEVEGGLVARHGVRGVGCWTVCGQISKSAVNPRLQTETVVQEDISCVQADEVRCAGFVVVDRDVGGAHHFNIDEASADGFGQLRHVVRRRNDGCGFCFFVIS